jgi:hypothetical protein
VLAINAAKNIVTISIRISQKFTLGISLPLRLVIYIPIINFIKAIVITNIVVVIEIYIIDVDVVNIYLLIFKLYYNSLIPFFHKIDLFVKRVE